MFNTESVSRISGGYVMLARSFDNSGINNASPCTREMFFLFMRKANHTTVVDKGNTFNRGSLLTTYEDIKNSLKWEVGYRKKSYSTSSIESSLKWLTKHEMITKAKTTRGLIITVCNYDYYQTPANYEHHTEGRNKTTIKPQSPATINKNDKNVKNEKNYPESVLTSFETFWELYDKKTGKKEKLITVWGKLKPEEITSIMAYVPKYKLTQPDKKFRKDVSTFLHNNSWHDELIGYDAPAVPTIKLSDNNNW